MKNLISAVLIVLSVCTFAAFAKTANAAQQDPVLQQGRATPKPLQQPPVANPSAVANQSALKPLQQPLFANPSAMLPLCSSLPQATDKLRDSIYDLRVGLKCEANFPKAAIENYGAQVKACCSPQKSFSVQEQQAAGCLNSDTVKQCMDKLTGYCINHVPEKYQLQNSLNFEPKRADDISIKMKEVSEQLKTLRSLMQ